MTIAEFIAAHPVEFSVVRTDSNPDAQDWPADAHHWKCWLKVGPAATQAMLVHFSQGSAHKVPPTLEEVLECLASEGLGFENAESFEEWASDLGYDTDSRKAERIYRAIEKHTDGLRRLFGRDGARSLMVDVGAEQD